MEREGEGRERREGEGMNHNMAHELIGNKPFY